jgi:hypothetical protein
LETTINKGLATLTQLRPSFALELPNCIDTNVKEITPLETCKDAGLYIGFMKFMSPKKNRVFTLRIDQAVFRTQKGILQIGMPLTNSAVANRSKKATQGQLD